MVSFNSIIIFSVILAVFSCSTEAFKPRGLYRFKVSQKARSFKSKYADFCSQITYYPQSVIWNYPIFRLNIVWLLWNKKLKIDHFNFNPDTDFTYQQRYIISDKFFTKGSPIFFYTGNEGDIQWFCENTVRKKNK